MERQQRCEGRDSALLTAAEIWAREKGFDMRYARSDTQRHESHSLYHQ